MEHGGGHEIGAHKLAHFAGMTFHLDTLYMTWLSMAIVILVAIMATRNLARIPTGWQNVVEYLVEAWLGQIEATIGPKGRIVAPLVITLFLFLLVSNWLGLVPSFTSPTNDLNTTLGLALMIIIIVNCLGIWNKGLLNHLSHFVKPNIAFLPINIVEEISKPITLSFRLFGNIMAGEILLIILGMLLPMWMPIPGVIWLGFSVVVGLIQAFIFTVLSISYLSSALEDHH